MKLYDSIAAFFYERISSRGFSLMRVAWAFIVFIEFLLMWKDVTYFFAADGVFPERLEYITMRDELRFTIFHWIDTPGEVFTMYLGFLVILFCMMIGLWPRLTTILSVLILFSFHERNSMIFTGGDTLLRAAGFLLMLAPGISGFSLARAEKQWLQWKEKRTLLPSLTMPIWPWRLLLWQMICLYGTSLWYKLLGTMWLAGTAVEATMHHPMFVRFPPSIINPLLPMFAVGDYLALIWQALWLLLLVPRFIIPKKLRLIPLRRILMLGGILFHGGILILMDAGVFSLAVFVVYFGLLRDEDFAWMKRVCDKLWAMSYGKMLKAQSPKPIAVLFDGHCGLCLRSIFMLRLFDWLGHLRYIDFRDKVKREKEAPGITEKKLDKAMHIRLPDGQYLTGFDAVRRMTWHMPALWIFAPFLYIPGIPQIGRVMYGKIADNRKKCDHENCAL